MYLPAPTLPSSAENDAKHQQGKPAIVSSRNIQARYIQNMYASALLCSAFQDLIEMRHVPLVPPLLVNRMWLAVFVRFWCAYDEPLSHGSGEDVRDRKRL